MPRSAHTRSTHFERRKRRVLLGLGKSLLNYRNALQRAKESLSIELPVVASTQEAPCELHLP